VKCWLLIPTAKLSLPRWPKPLPHKALGSRGAERPAALSPLTTTTYIDKKTMNQKLAMPVRVGKLGDMTEKKDMIENIKTVKDEYVIYDNLSGDEIFRGTLIECELYMARCGRNAKRWQFIAHVSE
jgi:hypothetical protein